MSHDERVCPVCGQSKQERDWVCEVCDAAIPRGLANETYDVLGEYQIMGYRRDGLLATVREFVRLKRAAGER